MVCKLYMNKLLSLILRAKFRPNSVNRSGKRAGFLAVEALVASLSLAMLGAHHPGTPQRVSAMRDPRPELLPAQPTTKSRPSLPAPSVAGRKRAEEAYGSIPLSFELNRGQADSTVKYLARGSGYVLFLSGDRALLALGQRVRAGKKTRTASAHFPSRPVGAVSLKPAALQLKILRASPNARVSAFGELPGRSNYFIGNDPTKWRTNIPNYSKVRYEGVYPGVDLVFYGSQGRLEYDFVLGAGVNPEVVSLGVEGAKKTRLSLSGDLILRVGGGEVVFQKPSAYQVKGDGHVAVAARFVLTGAKSVGFEVGPHDSRLPLVIDPVLSYSTYLGGTNSDQGIGIAVDSSGNAYVTGTTLSADFPTTAGAFNQTFNTTACVTITGSRPCLDVFVAKLNPAGSALVYSTFLRGRADDSSTRIAVDASCSASCSAYVTGTTASSDFPTTAGAFQTTLKGTTNAFVTKLDATGSALVYSTYLGGTSTDQGSAISVDASGSAYVTGTTASSDFPLMTPLPAPNNALQGSSDAFVTKLNPTGSALVYSTYLGSSAEDDGVGIAVDSSGNAYVTGDTFGSDFPTKNPMQAAYGGGMTDLFVTKLNAAGSAFIYSSYLGGSDQEFGRAIAVDGSGSAYVTGFTASANFPTANPMQAMNAGGGFDAFVVKVSGAPARAADTIPPVVSISANPSILWPPNGEMVLVRISGTITDSESGVDPSSAAYSVRDDYGIVQPSGPITLGLAGRYSLTILLQASRKGEDLAGRHYTVMVSAKDNAGNPALVSIVVKVP